MRRSVALTETRGERFSRARAIDGCVNAAAARNRAQKYTPATKSAASRPSTSDLINPRISSPTRLSESATTSSIAARFRSRPVTSSAAINTTRITESGREKTVEDRALRAEAAPLDQRVGDRDPRDHHRAEQHRQAVGKIATRVAATAGAGREGHADDEHQVAQHIDRRFGHADVGDVARAAGQVEREQERGRHEHHGRVQRRNSVDLPTDVRRADTHDCCDADRGEATGRAGERDGGERDDGEGGPHPCHRRERSIHRPLRLGKPAWRDPGAGTTQIYRPPTHRSVGISSRFVAQVTTWQALPCGAMSAALGRRCA